MATEIELSIEPNIEPEGTQRGYRWKLTSGHDWPVFSREVFATRREAKKEGEAALRRARQRRRVR